MSSRAERGVNCGLKTSYRSECSSLFHYSSKILKKRNRSSNKTMEEQFPELTIWRKWEQVVPGVAYSRCCAASPDSWCSTEHSFFQLLAVLVRLPHSPRSPHFPRSYSPPRQRSSWVTSWGLWNDCIQFNFSLCALLLILPLLPQRSPYEFY